MTVHAEPVENCASCPVGRAARVGVGGRCPLIERAHDGPARVYGEGEAAHHVWFVKRGAVLLSRREGGAPTLRAVRGPGAFVGIEALVAPTYGDTARIEHAAILCGGVRDDVERWLGPAALPARMALEQVLYAAQADRVRGAAADGSATRRVARWLLDADALELALPRAQVAGLLGMVPETLSRAIARLRGRGVIAATRRSIAITDRPALAALAR